MPDRETFMYERGAYRHRKAGNLDIANYYQEIANCYRQGINPNYLHGFEELILSDANRVEGRNDET